MTAAWLYLLAVTDWGFAGFRHAAGRDGRIFKARYYGRAVLVALAIAQVPLGAVAAVVVALVAWGPTDFAGMNAAATPMVWVYGAYATIVLSAFVPYLSGNTELRTLATVSVFGPLTMLRPAAIVAGAAVTVWATPTWPVAIAAAAAALVNVSAERILARAYPL